MGAGASTDGLRSASAIPPPPEPGPVVEVEEFPDPSPPGAGCMAAFVAFAVIIVGVSVILVIAGAFLTTQKRPFAEAEEVTRAFLDAAGQDNRIAMRDQLSEAGNEQISTDSLDAIARFIQDKVGRVVRLDRTEQELYRDSETGEESVHVAFVIHGSISAATVEANLHGPGGGLRITSITLREAR